MVSRVEQQEQDLDETETNSISQVTSTMHYLCSECPYKSSNRLSVQRHISLHLNGKGIICPLCLYTTSSNSSIIHHMTTIHPASRMETTFQNTPQIKTAHILEQYQCPLCSYQCDRVEALNLHHRLEHDDGEFDIDSAGDENHTVVTAKNLLDCPACSTSSNANSYSSLEHLAIHVVTNHNNQSCPFCSFAIRTVSSQTLLQHIKLHFNGMLAPPDPLVGIERLKESVIF